MRRKKGYRTADDARRANGKLGGRPPKSKTREEEQKKLRLLAQHLGKLTVVDNVNFLIAVRDGMYPEATVGDRRSAADSLLDRFGFPKAQMFGEVEDDRPKSFNLKNYEPPDASYEKAEVADYPTPPDPPQTPIDETSH